MWTGKFRGCVTNLWCNRKQCERSHQKASWQGSQAERWWKNKNDTNYRINPTNVDLSFSRIKLSFTLLEFRWEKVIILRILLTPRAWRIVLVCPHSILVSVIINQTNMAATSHAKLDFLKSKVKLCWIWTLSWRKN